MNIRPARVGDVPAIHELIRTFADRKLMIRRSLGELYESIREFLVATDEAGRVIGCVALHVFWEDLAELKALREYCQQEDLLVYMDGARIGNAAAQLRCTLAELAACADVLSFGGTKNGAMGLEAVLVMNEATARPAARPRGSRSLAPAPTTKRRPRGGRPRTARAAAPMADWR